MKHAATESFDVEIRDVVYLDKAGTALDARMYLPRGDGPFPLIVEIHGGAWCRGSRLDEHNMNEALARRGIAVAAIDFTMPPAASYPASLRDINFAVRWVKSTAAQWRTRPDLVGLLGVSSGGHQAIVTAMRPRDPLFAVEPLAPAHADIDARAAFVVACWPVIDPLGRYLYAKQLQSSGKPYPAAIDRVIPDQEKYWLSEAAMAEGSPAIALERGEPCEMPPLLYLQGEDDIVHPRAQLERFVGAWRRAGGSVTLHLYENEAESFITRRPDSPGTADAIADIGDFVLQQAEAILAGSLS
ncbi:alpha/beta hydrolase [Burkholderia sp. SRS-W-2-2016]|uniref:alpha/beta hydrolase n=1 Tax=Burkholderia sp. SRS-W-2-2016 TaxID=1926878 RepID=UPI000A614C36|nr:alpha/beta hydrolase [Burkholderia sp. SRS-W-2-2016]